MDDSVWKDLTSIFQDTLDDGAIALSPSTTAKDIPGWDSITHVLLMVAVERKFKIKFTAAEIQLMENVGELVRLISAKRTTA